MSRDILPVSDETVNAKTGKYWQDWFSLLDRAGARKMTHREIVGIVRIGDWACARCIKQRPGFRSAGAGRSVSLSRGFAERGTTLFCGPDYSKPEKQLQEKQRLESRSASRGPIENPGLKFASLLMEGCRVEHDRLASAVQAKRRKLYWSDRLSELERLLEGD